MESATSSTRQRSGYILLATLALLLLASLALLALCRTSLRTAAAANEEEESLRTRWVQISLGRALLPNVEAEFAAAERRSTTAVTLFRQTVTLNGQPVELIFSDESAKANVNAVLALRGGDITATRASFSSLLSGTGSAQSFTIRPETWLNGKAGTLAELFPDMAIENLIAGTRAPATSVTCWGDGRLNVFRAPEDVLKAVLNPVVLDLSQLQRLLSMRQENPRPSLTNMLDRLELDGSHRTLAEQYLSSVTTCHSLWIFQKEGRRTATCVYIEDQTAGRAAVTSFAW